MSLSSGRLHKVVIQAPTTVNDSPGGFSTTWATHTTAWSQIMPVSGREFDVAQQDMGVETVVFKMEWHKAMDTVNTTMRVRVDNYDSPTTYRYYDIEVVQNLTERNKISKLQCRLNDDEDSGHSGNDSSGNIVTNNVYANDTVFTDKIEERTADAGIEFSTPVDFGDPGFEQGAVTVNGATFNTAVKVNAFGGGTQAELVLHRHSNTDVSHVVISRARGTGAGHSDVIDGDSIGSFVFTGWNTSSYYMGAQVLVQVDGTPGVMDMPGRIRMQTSADGGAAPTDALVLRADKAAEFSGVKIEMANLPTGATAVAAGAAAGELWVTASHATLPDGVVMRG